MSATPLALAGALGGLGYLLLRTQTDDVFRDLSLLVSYVRVARFAKANLRQGHTVVDFFESARRKNPQGEALIYIKDNGRCRSYTFQEVDELSNKVANWALQEGVQPQDVVVVLMDNRPEFIITWLGLAKVGAISALINTNLRGAPLLHTLSISKAKHFIIGSEHLERILEVKNSDKLPSDGRWYLTGPAKHKDFVELDVSLAVQSPATPPDVNHEAVGPLDTLFYIYTSGTTGMPKASIVTHLRFMTAGKGFAEFVKPVDTDRIYCVLPLYHSAGGMIGVGISWCASVPLVLRRKFSVKNFWKDCAQYDCTIIQYIGELCRYLISHPESSYDQKHSVRVAVGNGLRSDVWPTFQKRFCIPQIVEFYGATEGNVALMNSFNRVGAVGFIPPLLRKVLPAKIVKFDVETEQPVRGPDGFCIECEAGEVGELLGLIADDDPLRSFKGYTDKKATKKKIIENVFKKGDKYFRTGDLLRIDADGFCYFSDRIGDTFRWKGENVATGEVAEVISKFPGVLEVNVYGVAVPGHDGRAGMASIVFKGKPDFHAFYEALVKSLPSYAVPLFLRLKDTIETTTTFKHKKVDLVREGFNPEKIEV